MKNFYNPLDLYVVRFSRRVIEEDDYYDDCVGYYIAKKVGVFKRNFALLSKNIVVSKLGLIGGYGVTEYVPLILVTKEGLPNKLSSKQILDMEKSINNYYETNIEEIEGHYTEDEDTENGNLYGDNDAEGEGER